MSVYFFKIGLKTFSALLKTSMLLKRIKGYNDGKMKLKNIFVTESTTL